MTARPASTPSSGTNRQGTRLSTTLLSLTLSRHYIERFGTILHHNVDKALLRGGAARPRFGGGEVREPIEIYLAGRAITRVGNVEVPVRELAVNSAREWLRGHLHALDVERHVRIHCLPRHGPAALADLLERGSESRVPLANDTSFGVGFAPLSQLERCTLELERHLNSRRFLVEHPAHGEDVKLMAVRAERRDRGEGERPLIAVVARRGRCC